MLLVIIEITLAVVLASLIWLGIRDSRAAAASLRGRRTKGRNLGADEKAYAQYAAHALNAAVKYDREAIAIDAMSDAPAAHATSEGIIVVLALYVGAPIGLCAAILAIGTVVQWLAGA